MSNRLHLAVLILLISGCALRENVITQSVDFNSAVARTNNQMILLNVLRSRDRSPTYFSRVTSARGSLSYSASTGGLVLPFGGDAKNQYSISPSVTASYNPTFDLQVMNSREFYSGFLQPVEPELVEYFLDQGWPRELILTLMVRRITITYHDEEGMHTREYTGYFPDSDKFREYQEIVRRSELTKLSSRTCISGLLKNLTPEDLHKLGGYFEKGYRLLPALQVDGKVTPQTEKECKAGGCGKCLGKISTNYALKFPRCPDYPSKMDGLKHSVEAFIENAERIDRDEMETEQVDGRVYLRSPEAIIYFLGEVVRVQQNTGRFLCLGEENATCSETSGEKLFELMPVSDGADYRLTVNYNGIEYGVGPIMDPMQVGGHLAGSGRTFSTMSIVSQLLGIHQSSKDSPVTPAVQVVN